jgi:dTDP-4-amino-4,6-dideoxygalactose transaminase
MVTTADDDLARQVQILRDHGSAQRYYHDLVGLNGRLDELQAAVLRIKLRHLDGWNEQRRRNAALYNEALQDCGVVTPTEASWGRHVYHLYVIRTNYRDELRAYLAEQGIGTGIHYPVPLHLQKACEGCVGHGLDGLPVTEAMAGEILSLPMFPELGADQIQRVAGEIRGFLSSAAG